eukprot:Gregarina_sp_Poly_1__7164@NODE_392_length_8959_cov_63_078835_g321_i0_p4_GENE_NODE_392_length_8959_cov_63_078835_g321_i0NODE_392_length_8959_cov_63_078835_g321_i0_p4_ORF_typecomplete_len321_score33_81Nop52/PF05997_12/1_1e13Nop52/PF05997_12/5_2e02_NODE_392_length_8959_cov_63_078835_g321_i044065368
MDAKTKSVADISRFYAPMARTVLLYESLQFFTTKPLLPLGYFLCDGTGPIRECGIQICQLLQPAQNLVHKERTGEFLCACMLTLHLQWERVDKWRIEKLQTLIRILCAELLDEILRSNWDVEFTQSTITGLLVSSPGLLLPNQTPSEEDDAFPPYYNAAREFANPLGTKGVLMQFIECWVAEWQLQVANLDLTDSNIQKCFGSMLSFFSKFLTSHNSGEMVIRTVLDKFFRKLILDQTLFKDQEVIEPVAKVLFYVALAKSTPKVAREGSLQLVELADEQLMKLGKPKIEYEVLAKSPLALDLSFSKNLSQFDFRCTKLI